MPIPVVTMVRNENFGKGICDAEWCLDLKISKRPT